MKSIKLIFALCLSTVIFSSCSDDDNPVPVNEEELITTVRLVLEPANTGSQVVFQSVDLDADGPNPPDNTITGTLVAGVTYTGTIQFLNEIESPAENITVEVLEEADEHQVFYTVTGNSGSVFTYNDMDEDGNPIGVNVSFNSGVAGTGNSLTITLRHEPNKAADGVSDGNITNAGGETDIETTFTFDVN